ncbi:hypothetical protein KIW84_040857 [Lathyrus oleraceus]|uniref:Integrase zinc-binding domain-containing protein n=1 Tax=Pisum sativum TaxID=3888 RepID=A0A9D5AQD4_PEA|nr:hypothetical protein KIW84_040857 [Pisum sativum]
MVNEIVADGFVAVVHNMACDTWCWQSMQVLVVIELQGNHPSSGLLQGQSWFGITARYNRGMALSWQYVMCTATVWIVTSGLLMVCQGIKLDECLAAMFVWLLQCCHSVRTNLLALLAWCNKALILDIKDVSCCRLQYLSMMQGVSRFEFEIQYKEGTSNLATDPLSRKEGAELLTLILGNAGIDLLEYIQLAWKQDSNLKVNITNLKKYPSSHDKYSRVRDELRRKGKSMFGFDQNIKESILEWLHSSALGGHYDRDMANSRVNSIFYWKGTTKDIINFFRNCGTCQKNKSDLAAYPGLLQPLPIRNKKWTHISMYFVERIPNSAVKHVILVVVDRLKTHFMALSHPYTALDVAQLFLDNVVKLHGLLEITIGDKDPIFPSKFWHAFLTIRVALHKSTA